MQLLDEMKSFISRVSVSTNNFKAHFSKWGTHTRLGGLIDYRKQEVEELRAVNITYQECLLYDRKTENKSEKNYTVLDVNDKGCPLAQAHEIHACFTFDASRKPGGCMTNFRCVFDLIKACIHHRFESFAATGYTHVNTAVILFCAELSLWVREMSKLEVTNEMLQEIDDRIQYLSRIEEEQLFKEEAKTDYSIYMLIYNVTLLLKRLIRPEVEALLNEKRSREYFKQLFDASNSFFDVITRGLFCAYTDDIQSSEIFHISSINLITNQQLEKTLSTPFGECFNQLAKSYAVTQWSTKTIEARFNDESGIPLESEIFTLLSENSGICRPFKTQEKIRPLLTLLGLLYDFSIFINSVKQAYALSGIGGDILMYIGLCQETRDLVDIFSNLMDKICYNLSKIEGDSESYYSELIKKQEKNPWRANYSRSKQNFSEANRHLQKAYEAIYQISVGMRKVSSQKYLQKVNQKMQNFQQTIIYLKKRTADVTPSLLEESVETKNLPSLSREGALAFFSSQTLIDRQRTLAAQFHSLQVEYKKSLDNNT